MVDTIQTNIDDRGAATVWLNRPDVPFAFTEARLGLTPATIRPYVIAAMGERQARRYFLTGESFTAHEACRIGLVPQVCKLPDLLPLVNQTVDTLITGGPVAQKEAKKLIRP